MIDKIIMSNVASYKQETCLKTGHKFNLIYGLNGSGKSTFSDFLYGRKDIDFSRCSIYPPLDDGTKIIVYNQSFINDNFYQNETQAGIFSLSKENKAIQQKIDAANKELEDLQKQRNEQEKTKVGLESRLSKIKDNAVEQIWKIKTEFTGGDRVLGFCLDGLNHPKTKPFEYILTIPKPLSKSEKTIEQLKQEAVILQKNAAPIDTTIPIFDFPASRYEKDPIFKKNIVGNENSSISSLIKQLDNQNWVQEGLKYLESGKGDRRHCPFCQQETITEDFIQKIKDFFSGEYKEDIQYLDRVINEYGTAIRSIYNISTVFFENIPFLNDLKQEFQRERDRLCDILERNIDKMREKHRTPNIEIVLENSEDTLKKVNDVLSIACHRVEDYNQKILQKQQSLNKLKSVFWQIQRWEYDQTISLYTSNKLAIDKEINGVNSNIKAIDKRVAELMNLISEEQKKTINIKDAIDHINSNLLAIGIDAFRVDQYQNNLYKITRNGQSGSVFPSLSEGEKMIISFLYFLELCRGKRSGAEVITKKIIVIDDPISSLSHIYVFNVCKLIEDEFFKNNSNYEQIFILTHSLYFFHELHKQVPHPNYLKGDSDEVKEKNYIETINKVPKLFRFSKNSISSCISTMQPTEIQNDYQAYWSIIKDSHAPHALIANAMRQVIEYFFGFINKSNFNNVFQKPALRDNKFQAFNRFMNVESHSRAHLICDYKEFNYDIFVEAFRLVFVEAGYEEHFNDMMRIEEKDSAVP